MLRRWLIAFVAVLALSLEACGPVDDNGPLVLSPSSDAAVVTTEWAARWCAASGIHISIAGGGTPVELWSDVWVTDTEAFDHQVPGAAQVCGATKGATRGRRVHLIAVDATPPPSCKGGWGYALGHELGHALTPGSTDDHSEPGTLMGESLQNGTRYVIDEASLAAVCSSAPCSVFLPESR